MPATRFVLVRHGASMAQETKVVGGHLGCTGLSDLGRRQAHALAGRLRATGELSDATVLYASLMPRAIETASIIADAIGVHDISQECDFCELHPGEGDGLAWTEFDRRYPPPEQWDPDVRRDPGGETWSEMHARVARGLDTIMERHPGETVVVACHGGVVVHSMIRWLDLNATDPSRRAWLNAANTSLTEWRVGANPFEKRTLPLELVRYNDHAHLANLGDAAAEYRPPQ